ncbi:MAG: Dynein light chain [Watsoniomyces obsoletus]|nr:MAG: Dynein light chain [Watsoniomyces obsoletus]
MSSSRIFVRGLPPKLSDEDFKKHFSTQQTITDAKFIPQRRIGYVGYKTAEDAARAVKYFNKSFIGQARIYVEIARPINNHETEGVAVEQPSKSRQTKGVHPSRRDHIEKDDSKNTLKRKRDAQTEAAEDPKLQEFLQVMQGRAKSKTWANQDINDAKTKNSPGELKDDNDDSKSESEDDRASKQQKTSLRVPTLEKKAVDKKAQLGHEKLAPNQHEVGQQSMVSSDIQQTEDVVVPQVQPTTAVSDRDWLRSKTSRLLGLLDEDEEEDARPTVPERRDELDNSLDEASPSINQRPQHEGSVHPNPEGDPDLPRHPEVESGRLFIRNLSYTATVDDLRDCFSSHGDLTEVHIPTAPDGSTKGLAYISYKDPQSAAQALEALDGSVFQGRLMHVIPAAAKVERKLDEFALSKLPLKKQRQIKRKAEAGSTVFNWNAMFMSADAVMSSISDRLKIAKSDLLDPTSSDAAVKQAHAETHIIQETKQYFTANGVDLDAFQQQRERGDTTILIKNFPYGTTASELKTMFGEFGPLSRLLMPPAGTVAIVEFVNPGDARTAFSKLAYRRFKNSILFLEKAPKHLFKDAKVGTSIDATTSTSTAVEPKVSATDVLPVDDTNTPLNTSTLYVRNLNFTTTTTRLREVCRSLEGFLSALVKTKPDLKKPGQTLSMGFGFLEFRTTAHAQAAAVTLDGYDLDHHRLVVKAARRDLDAAEATKKDDQAKKARSRKTKVIIKNLPFEASKKDVRALFGSYGQLRSVRVPKKFDHTTRGFAFADFVTAREAENAITALKDTHLLGRRLVLEFAAENPTDAEEEIQRMQDKVTRQTDRVAVQKLVGTKRSKFNLQNGDDEELG